MLKLPHHKRYDFLPITKRKHYTWPGGKRLAFYIALNIEHFAFQAGLGMDPHNRTGPQTSRNYAWRDYGNRIGNWRFFEILDELKLPAIDPAEFSGLLRVSRRSSRRSSSAATTCSATAAPMPRCCAACGRTTSAASSRNASRSSETRGRPADRLDGSGRR